jgi:hypothetical protein
MENAKKDDTQGMTTGRNDFILDCHIYRYIYIYLAITDAYTDTDNLGKSDETSNA